jgi:hypothetical protein
LDSERVLSENSAELSGDFLRGTVVIVQQATQAQVSANRSVDRHLPERLNQLVTDALMVPLAMVVRHEVGKCAPKVAFTERNHAMRTLP